MGHKVTFLWVIDSEWLSDVVSISCGFTATSKQYQGSRRWWERKVIQRKCRRYLTVKSYEQEANTVWLNGENCKEETAKCIRARWEEELPSASFRQFLSVNPQINGEFLLLKLTLKLLRSSIATGKTRECFTALVNAMFFLSKNVTATGPFRSVVPLWSHLKVSRRPHSRHCLLNAAAPF